MEFGQSHNEQLLSLLPVLDSLSDDELESKLDFLLHAYESGRFDVSKQSDRVLNAVSVRAYERDVLGIDNKTKESPEKALPKLKKLPKQRKAVTFMIDVDDIKGLEQLAIDCDRSVSAQLRTIIKAAISQQNKRDVYQARMGF